jgi:hypothetical protein
MSYRIRVIEKTTNRTWMFYPHFGLCFATGHMHIIGPGGGYTETNDRGDPVLDSWVKCEWFGMMGG